MRKAWAAFLRSSGHSSGRLAPTKCGVIPPLLTHTFLRTLRTKSHSSPADCEDTYAPANVPKNTASQFKAKNP